jgi:phthiocerol/phenolphthiocerol synthesis type-I polyketide synthase E
MSTTHPEEGVAVIGLAGRFPGAPNLDAFWENLKNGVESIRHFSDDELEVPTAMRETPGYVRARAIIDGVDLFDAEFFGFQPREAQYTDPQHRLLLETAWEALENAGCDPTRFDGAIGVFAGCSQNTYLLHNLASNPKFLAEYLASQQMGAHPALLGNDKDFLATRISYKLNLRGPSVAVQSACSTSLVAVCQAAQSLLTFGCDLALAGGVSVTFPQKRGYLYEEGSIVSKDGRCRPFDAAADGTVFGDGVGMVVLKRADEALRDGDHVYAIIRGFAVNNDGSDKVSYMAPSVEGQYEAIATAHALAGVAPESIRYVEAHGTGTALGDPIEVAALTKAFRSGTGEKQFCALSALKGNIGHLEAAAGVAGLIKAVLAVYHGEIPPTLNFSQPNPRIDFAQTPFYVASKLERWPETIEPRRAGVSSFGVGGTNAHLVLEQAPPATRPAHDPAPQLLVLSARTETALEEMSLRLREHLEKHPQMEMADVAQTLQLGRRGFNFRRSIVARTAPEAVTILAGKLSAASSTQGRTAPVAFLFPGQGAQAVGMGRELYYSDETFRAEVDRACELIEPELKLDLRDVLFPKEASAEADSKLTQTSLTQPALFVIEHALAQVWLARGVRPQIMLGHSLGEYVAAVLAGVFSLPDALHLLAVRGRLMQQLPPGRMLAVALSEVELAPYLTDEVGLAAVNGPQSCVVSGPPEAVAKFHDQLTAATGAACRELKTSHAFHSVMMDPILAEFGAEVARVRRQAPSIPIVSSLRGRVGTDDDWTSPSYWSAQLRRPVRFADAMGALLVDTSRVFLEVGPGNTLCALARQHPAWQQGRVAVPSLNRKVDEGILAATGQLWQAGVPVRVSALHPAPARVALPTYPFQRKSYWIERTTAEAVAVAPGMDSPVSEISADVPPDRPSIPADRVAVEKLIDEQMRVMARQLEILRAVPMNGSHS